MLLILFRQMLSKGCFVFVRVWLLVDSGVRREDRCRNNTICGCICMGFLWYKQHKKEAKASIMVQTKWKAAVYIIGNKGANT